MRYLTPCCWNLLRLSVLSLSVIVSSGTIVAADKPAEKRAEKAAEKADAQPPTFADVAYGPHERNVLDFWQAPGAGSRPLVVFIHGGGWTSGDKAVAGNPQKKWLDKGVSYAAINYRLTPRSPLPAPVHDAARAIQFLRTKAKDWHIDSRKICLTGTSAGACTSMWLVCHDDLADPKSADPVLRESTRVAGAAVNRGQSSIDPKQIEPWLGPNVLQHRMINMAVGESTMDAALKNYERHRALYVEFSPINHVSADDPPLLMTCDDDVTVPSRNAGHGIHHPLFGLKIKEKADAVGMECHIILGKGSSATSKFATADEFIESILLKR